MDQVEFEKRKMAALAAIREASGSEGGESSVDLFVAHHVEELPQAYWQQHLATATPEPSAVILMSLAVSALAARREQRIR